LLHSPHTALSTLSLHDALPIFQDCRSASLHDSTVERLCDSTPLKKPRIISLLPSCTEIVCTLGLADRLVGRSHECDFPPAENHTDRKSTRLNSSHQIISYAVFC